jgi:REP element-mobilizing transposase RayT
MESRYIHKSHIVSVLMYHLVCAAKYRRVLMSKHMDAVLKEACIEIQKRWETGFLEIGFDRDHANFLIQLVPTYSVTPIVTTVKSVIAWEVFAKAPEVKDKLWGGEFWGKEYFANTVGEHGSESVIAAYVAGQGTNYKQLHKKPLPARSPAKSSFLSVKSSFLSVFCRCVVTPCHCGQARRAR